jgi:hypothetical protein
MDVTVLYRYYKLLVNFEISKEMYMENNNITIDLVTLDVKSMDGWEEFQGGKDFTDYCNRGDYVSEDIYDYFLNILPPVTVSSGYLQAGGEIMTAFNEKKNRYEGVYLTFVSTNMKGIYSFCGCCFKGQIDDVRVYRGYNSINDFLCSTYRNKFGFSDIRPVVKCKDGFEFSVQVGANYYSNPRLDGDSICYTSCEVGYPTKKEELLIPYIEEEDADPTKTIYPYTPVEVIDKVIKKHGGFYIAVCK